MVVAPILPLFLPYCCTFHPHVGFLCRPVCAMSCRGMSLERWLRLSTDSYRRLRNGFYCRVTWSCVLGNTLNDVSLGRHMTWSLVLAEEYLVWSSEASTWRRSLVLFVKLSPTYWFNIWITLVWLVPAKKQPHSSSPKFYITVKEILFLGSLLQL